LMITIQIVLGLEWNTFFLFRLFLLVWFHQQFLSTKNFCFFEFAKNRRVLCIPGLILMLQIYPKSWSVYGTLKNYLLFWNGQTFLNYSLIIWHRIVRTVVSFINIYNEQLLRPYSCAKKLQSQNVTREKLHKTLFHKKGDWKMLMKLTPRRVERSARFELLVLPHERKSASLEKVNFFFWLS